MGLPEAELEDLVSRGRLFTVITKLLIKWMFCLNYRVIFTVIKKLQVDYCFL
jgi:hypothetical protein